MKKVLNEEIVRIHELMNLDKENLISEVGFVSKQASTFKNVIKYAVSEIGASSAVKMISKADAKLKLNKFIDEISSVTDDSGKQLRSLLKSAGDDVDLAVNKITSYIDNLEVNLKNAKITEIESNIKKLETEANVAQKEILDNNWLGKTSSEKGTEEAPLDGSLKKGLEDITDWLKLDRDLDFDELSRYPSAEDLINGVNSAVDDIIDNQMVFRSQLAGESNETYSIAQQYHNKLKEFLRNKLKERVRDFKTKEGKTIPELYENLPLTRKSNNQFEILPDDFNNVSEKYNFLIKKLKTQGEDVLSESERAFLDAVDGWKSGINTLDKVLNTFDNIKVKKPVGSEAMENIPSGWSVLGFFKGVGDWFYTAFYPYWRKYLYSIKAILTSGESAYDDFATLFYKKFSERVKDFKPGNPLAKKADIYRIIYSLQSAPDQFAKMMESFSPDSNIYKELWEKFVKEGEEYFSESGNRFVIVGDKQIDALEAFKRFCKDIENYQSDHLILGKKKFKGFKALIEESGDEETLAAIKNKEKRGESDFKVETLRNFDKLKTLIWDSIKNVLRLLLSNPVGEAVYTWFKGGNFQTPAEFEDWVTARYKSGGRQSTLKSFFGVDTKIPNPLNRRLTGGVILGRIAFRTFIFIPAVIGTFLFLYDLVMGTLFNIKRDNLDEMKEYFGEDKNKKYKFDIDSFGKYLYYQIMTSGTANDFMVEIFNGMSFKEAQRPDTPSNWKEYLMDVGSRLPGYDMDFYSFILLNASQMFKETGDKTKEQAGNEVLENITEESTKLELDNANDQLRKQGDNLKDEYGEDYNAEETSSGWVKYFDSNQPMLAIYGPKYYLNANRKTVFHFLKNENIISNALFEYTLNYDNKEIIWGLNPAAIIGAGKSTSVNNEKDKFLSKLKELKLKNLLLSQEEKAKFGADIGQSILKLTEDPVIKKRNPFMIFKKGGKNYIIDYIGFESNNWNFDTNTVTYYTPDYQTMMDALYDPKKKLVKNDYVLSEKDKDNGLTENNLVRVKKQSIVDFLNLKENNMRTMRTNKTIVERFIKILQEEEEKEEFKLKEWDDAFTFQKIDDKNPGKFKDVELKMKDVMDRMPHWRRVYKKECEENNEKGDKGCDDGEDDSFVRSVIDTHPDVVRILVTRGLAKITTSDEKIKMEEGLSKILRLIREERNAEVEVWSVYRHKSSPDKIWSLVKGDFKQSEMESMSVGMQKSPGNDVKKKEDTLTSLKKKELTAIENLKKSEKNGLFDLPRKLRERLQNKFSEGWTTEIPRNEDLKFYEKKDMKSTFNGDITLYKIKNSEEFFSNLEKSSSNLIISRGLCKTMVHAKKEGNLTPNQKKFYTHFLNKCQDKYEGKFGVKSFDM